MIDMIAQILVLVGAINWLSIGTMNKNLVSAIIGDEMLQKAIYTIVGLAAVYLIYAHFTEPKKQQ